MNKEILGLNYNLKVDPIDIYRTFCPKAEYKFSSIPGTFPKMDHMLGHKTR
jgi:hypothetical protein